MAKQNVTVVSQNPLVLTIRKNKRGVNVAAAKAAVTQKYPEIPLERWFL